MSIAFTTCCWWFTVALLWCRISSLPWFWLILMYSQFLPIGQHIIVIMWLKDQIIIFILRFSFELSKASGNNVLIVIHLVISIYIFRWSFLVFCVVLYFTIILTITKYLILLIIFSPNVTWCYFLIIDQFSHIFLINATCFKYF